MGNLIIKKSLADSVAEQIRQQITDGIYHLDQKLPIEPELMKEFGVGRSTIREAIRILANSGLLRVRQGLGTFVAHLHGDEPLEKRLQRAELQDLFEVRELLEARIAERAATHRTTAHLATMEKHLRDRLLYAEQGKISACIQADIAFHLAIAEACGNEILTDLYRAASQHVLNWFISQFTATGIFLETQQLHENLLASIRDKKPEQTREIVKNIIGRI